MRINRLIYFVLLIGLMLHADLIAQSQSLPNLRVAVASNFSATAKQLFSEFERQQNVEVTVSSGSSGALYAQIVHGAPFDLFLSADAMRPKLLDEQGLIIAGTRLAYARGQLALWDHNLVIDSPQIDATSLRSLLENTRRISLANPTTAPYGSAAMQLLEELKISSSLLPNVVQGNSVLQAYQFVETGNVSRGLVAYHLVKRQPNVVLIPQNLYPPIEQYMVVLKTVSNLALAKELQYFLRSSGVQNTLLTLGYAQIESKMDSP